MAYVGASYYYGVTMMILPFIIASMYFSFKPNFSRRDLWLFLGTGFVAFAMTAFYNGWCLSLFYFYALLAGCVFLCGLFLFKIMFRAKKSISLIHLSVILVAFGAILVSRYESQEIVQVKKGAKVTLADDSQVALLRYKVQPYSNYLALTATVVWRGKTFELQRRDYYNRAALQTIPQKNFSGLNVNLLTLGEEVRPDTFLLRVKQSPFLVLVWAGCLLLFLGCVLSFYSKRFKLKE